MKRNFIRTIQKSKALKMLICCFFCLALLINLGGSFSVSAAPAVGLIAVGAESFWGLLAAMGIAVGGTVGGYAISQEFPYIYDTFCKFGTDAADFILALPENLYWTDGLGNYYMGDGVNTAIPVNSVGQLVFDVNNITLTSTLVPQNLTYIPPFTKQDGAKFLTDASSVWKRYGTNVWWVEYFIHDGKVIVGDYAYKWNDDGCLAFNWRNGSDVSFNGTLPDFEMTWSPTVFIETPSSTDRTVPVGSRYGLDTQGQLRIGWGDSGEHKWFSAFNKLGGFYTLSDTGVPITVTVPSSDYLNYLYGGWLITREKPTLEYVIDLDKVDGYITPAPTPDPEDPDGDDHDYEMLPYSEWELYETLADLLTKTLTNNTNNSTTLGDFVNNNYNYNTVEIDVDVPDAFDLKLMGDLHFDIDQNVTLGGGINVDITINDNTELPSVSDGDGENFFSANVLDVFAGLTYNNPVMAMLFGLFKIIDPGLVAIFSVCISLSLLLALWKLIRG